jgi:hypothetical protein
VPLWSEFYLHDLGGLGGWGFSPPTFFPTAGKSHHTPSPIVMVARHFPIYLSPWQHRQQVFFLSANRAKSLLRIYKIGLPPFGERSPTLQIHAKAPRSSHGNLTAHCPNFFERIYSPYDLALLVEISSPRRHRLHEPLSACWRLANESAWPTIG